jgi:hypothetical protein
MKTFIATLLLSGLAAVLLAGSVNAKPVYSKTYKPGIATRYVKSGSSHAVPDVKATIATRRQWVGLNPQPEPPMKKW